MTSIKMIATIRSSIFSPIRDISAATCKNGTPFFGVGFSFV